MVGSRCRDLSEGPKKASCRCKEGTTEASSANLTFPLPDFLPQALSEPQLYFFAPLPSFTLIGR